MPPHVTFLSHPQTRDSGDYRHRTLWPAQALSQLVDVYALQTAHPEAFEAVVSADLLVVGMIADPDIHALIELRRTIGRPTVYEISDDFRAFPENTSLGTCFYARPDVQAQIESTARLCDGLQFSSPFLQEKYGHLNDCHAVFMNQAWTTPVLQSKPRNEQPRIGWTASGGHLHDAMELARLFRYALDTHPSLQNEFSLCLMTTDRIAQVFRDHHLLIEHTPSGSFESYERFVGTLDAGIAHLQIDDFAQGRSDGKYIEYASHGVPILCHRSGTFQHTVRHLANGLVYRTAEEFGKGLSALVRDPRLRDHLRTQAHRDLVTTRNHAKAAEHRLSFYRRLHPTLGDQHGASPQFHHWIHPIEDRLYRLMVEHNQNPLPSTLQGLLQLSKEYPDAWRVWERLRALYQLFGLTEHEELLDSKAEMTKRSAVERAYRLAA
ncbi:MAG: hypothetical protein VXW32_16495 [Myxococcota bacterium]|nr:hypothetical protein [Myxococcota bacterium]